MKPATQHAHEDRLLELAYGELPPADAAAVQHHLQDCERCSQALASIRGVRTAMAPLASEAAPTDGLDSLLAYAEQAAKRNRESAPARSPWWRRWSVALSTACALGLVVMVAQRGLEEGAPVSTAPVPPAGREAAKQAEPLAQAAAMEEEAEASPKEEGAGLEGGAEQERVGVDELRLAEARPQAASKGVEQKRSKQEAAKRLTFGDASSRADWSNAGAGQRAELPKGASTPAAKPVAAVPPPPPSKLAKELPEEGRGRGGNGGGIAAAPVIGGVGDSDPAPMAAGGGKQSAGLGAVAEAPVATSKTVAAPERKSRAAAPSAPAPVLEADPQRLSKQAAAARADGDRNQESILLQRALAAGATGSLRADLLARACEVEDALGRTTSADAVCARLLQEFPGSSSAEVARRRRARQLSDEAARQPASEAK